MHYKIQNSSEIIFGGVFFFENDTILYYYTASMYLNFEERISSLLLFTQIIVIMSIINL